MSTNLALLRDVQDHESRGWRYYQDRYGVTVYLPQDVVQQFGLVEDFRAYIGPSLEEAVGYVTGVEWALQTVKTANELQVDPS